MANIFGYGSFGAKPVFMGAEPRSAEEALRLFDSSLSALNAERSQDAADFQALVSSGKRRLDLVFEVQRAQGRLAAENSAWELSHQNAAALQAAQQAADAAQGQYDQVTSDVKAYRDAVNVHAARIQDYWSSIEDLIASMPAEQQSQARAAIEACRIRKTMNGDATCEHGEGALGCKKCQRGRKNKRYRPPPSPFEMAGGFLGQVPVAGAVAPIPVPVSAAAGALVPVAPVELPKEGITPLGVAVGAGILALVVGLVVFSRG